MSEMTLLAFHADWCGPCLKMRPIIHQIAVDHDLKVEHIDVDEDKVAVERYGINGVPTLILVDPDDREVARVTGAAPKRMVVTALGL